MGNWLIKLGQWLNTRFPEKMSAESVRVDIVRLDAAIMNIQENLMTLLDRDADMKIRMGAAEAAIADLMKKAEIQVSEMNKAKVFLNLRGQAPAIHR